MKNRSMASSLAFVIAAFALLSPALAQNGNIAPNASSSASEIMMKVYNRPQPTDMSALLTMTLIDSKGRERVRSIKQMSASFGTMEKKIMQFQDPADVRGTSFMNWSYAEAGKGDDQWIDRKSVV